jgi:hypothetical protein
MGMDTTDLAYKYQTPIVKFGQLAQGTYLATMKDGAGCQSNTVTVVIGKDTALDLTLVGVERPTCAGNDGYMVVRATYGSHDYTYSLSKDGGATYGAEQKGRIFGGLVPGPYVVRGMDSRGCWDTLHVTVPPAPKCLFAAGGSTDNLSVTDKNSVRLQVAPNPTRTTFTLNLQSSSKEGVQIVVTDMAGRKLYQATGSSTQQYTFGHEFGSGMYILQIMQGKQIQTLKLIKEN